jgi:hypothetical protein
MSISLTDQYSLLLVAFSRLGSPALASMPGSLQENAERLATIERLSSAYILHTLWI